MRIAWVLVVVAACGDGGKSAVDAATSDAPSDGTCSASRTIFLNRGGGSYTVGPDDATTNTSSVIGMNRTIAAPATTDPDWTAVLACVRSKVESFPITVTDVDPGAVPHIEVVVISNGNEIGVPGLTAGAASTPCVGGFGSAATNTIAFATWLGDNFNHCWDISMAIGYTLGLDNVLTCADVMSVMPTPCSIAGKAFTDAEQPCGDFSARGCRCGGTMQNAAQRISANLGCR